MLKQILQDGRDVTDTAFEGRSGETLNGLQLVITNQVNSVAGALVDGTGAPLVDGTVIVFAADSEKWSEDSRFVRFTRPDSDGNFSIKGLPPGEYLAAAVDYVEEGMWNDPEYLESIRRYGQKVTLGDADARTVSLKIVTP
jgi:Carboxypeptidase regulatory-like domain